MALNLLQTLQLAASKPTEEAVADAVFQIFAGSSLSPSLAWQVILQIDPAFHQYALLNVWSVVLRRGAEIRNDNAVISRALELLQNLQLIHIRKFPEQASLAFEALGNVAAYSQSFHIRGCFVHAFEALIERLQAGVSSELLTGAHPEFLKLCILTKQYRRGLKILAQPAIDITPQAGVSALTVLLYFYYGGLVYTVLREWRKAAEFFQNVLSVAVDQQNVNAVSIVAFTKFVLVSLLLEGKPLQLPFTSIVLQGNLKTAARIYMTFCKAYEEGQVEELLDILAKNQESFQSFHNIGLAKLCVKTLIRRKIQKLTQTYATISIDSAAQLSGVSNAHEFELTIIDMVQNNEIFARIDHENNLVQFYDPPESHERIETSITLQQQVAENIRLAKKLESLDREIQLSTPYIRKILESETTFDHDGGDEI